MIVTVAALACGCAPLLTGTHARPGTSSDPFSPWVPPAEEARKLGKVPQAPQMPPVLPLERLKQGAPLTVVEVVGVALRNNPLTYEAWMRAQAAAASVGVARSDYFPALDGRVEWLRAKQAALGGRFDFQQTIATPGLQLSWMLLDFGGRSARIAAAKEDLVAANLAHDRVLQDVILQVETAFVQYLQAKALSEVGEATVQAAQASVDAAQARLTAGLATKADLLQAKTVLSQALLQLETVHGQVDSVKGALATAMGLPANIPVEVGVLPPDVPVTDVTKEVDQLLATAVERRPDLLAARAQAEAAASRVSASQSNLWPSLMFDAGVDHTWFLTDLSNIRGANNYQVSFNVNVPIFSGFARRYDVQRNEAFAQESKAAADALEQQVVLQVWTSYFALRTTSRQLAVARDLVTSASESFDVAQGRYREGVGDILDLLSAQNALANARATEVNARTGWFLALASLAHDTGLLVPPEPGSPLPVIPGVLK